MSAAPGSLLVLRESCSFPVLQVSFVKTGPWEHTRVWKWFTEARPSDCHGSWGAGNPLLQLAQDTGVPVILDKEVTLERKKSPSFVLGQHSPPSSPANTKKLSLIFDFSWEFWAFSLASQLSAVRRA